MKDDFENVYDLVEHAIEYAFEGKLTLKFYEFLKYRKTKKYEVDSFIDSSTALELRQVVDELGEYIKGGRDSDHQQLREAYGNISKPQARKIKAYLGGILEDAVRYSYDRRPGRRKNTSNKIKSEDLEINKGVELLLRNKNRRREEPKTFIWKFRKMLSFFGREIHLSFDFQLDLKKT